MLNKIIIEHISKIKCETKHSKNHSLAWATCGFVGKGG